MNQHDRSNQRRATPDVTEGRLSWWAWLKRKENRAALQFIGAAIVAAIGLATSLMTRHSAVETPPRTPAQSSAQASAPAAAVTALAPIAASATVNQNAVTNGGRATIVNGNNNQIGR
jgi:hypothetical protein